LVKAWENIAEKKCSTLRRALAKAIEPRVDQGAASAQQGAASTVEDFGAELAWNTYKATMIREGVFKKNLNELLIEPIINHAASSWNRVFSVNISAMFQEIPDLLMNEAEKTFKRIDDRLGEVPRDRLRDVKRHQRKALAAGFQWLVEKATLQIRDIQKDISRQISPDIQHQLRGAYRKASKEHGSNSLARMKDIMLKEVKIHNRKMFVHTAKQTAKRLEGLGNTVYVTMSTEFVLLQEAMRLGYSVVWEDNRASKDQILCRRAVRQRARELKRAAIQHLELAKQADEKRMNPVQASSSKAPTL